MRLLFSTLLTSLVLCIHSISVVPVDDPFGQGFLVDTGTKMKVLVGQDGAIRQLVYDNTAYIKSQHNHLLQSGAFGSGLTGTTMSHRMVGEDLVVFEFTGTDVNAGLITGYYVFRQAESRIYIGVKPHAEPKELRYIFRLSNDIFPHSTNRASDVRHGKALESLDVVVMPDGTTRSKFYSSVPFKYAPTFGLSGIDGHALYFAHTRHTFEGMSGGPFHRDINAQITNTNTELTAYFYSSHSMNEAPRLTLRWTTVFVGSVPDAEPDLSFLDNLGIQDHVNKKDRGCLSGSVAGMRPLGTDCSRSMDYYEQMKQADAASVDAKAISSFSKGRATVSGIEEHKRGREYTVGLSSAQAQYWADASHGSFQIDGILPGTYMQTLYEDQRIVNTQQITITAGKRIRSSESVPDFLATIFTIGCYDGRPYGFRNADKIERKHPLDIDMADWNSSKEFIVGDALSEFPMAQIEYTLPTKIHFILTPAEAARATTLLIAISADYYGARPTVVINGLRQADPGRPQAVVSYGKKLYEARGLSHGAYNKVPREYKFRARFKPGHNTVTIGVLGRGATRYPFQRSHFIYDSVQLY